MEDLLRFENASSNLGGKNTEKYFIVLSWKTSFDYGALRSKISIGR